MANNRSPVPAAKGAPAPRRKKTVTILLIVLASLLVVGGVIGAVVAANWDEYKKLAADRKVVAICNNYEIPYEELRFVTMFYKDMLANTYGADIWDDPATAESYREELEKLVRENLNQNYVVLSACASLGIKTGGSELESQIDDQIDGIKQSCESKKEYKAWLDEHWMTEHYLRFSISVNILESALYYAMMDKDMFFYTLENAGDFMDYVEDSGDFVRTIHVFIDNKDGEDPAANLARAKEISDELRAIDDPQARRSKMSEYIGSKDNDDLTSITGDGYYFTRGEMDEAYEDASFGLEMGEVSEPVVCSGGNFIIMRLYPETSYIASNVSSLLDNYHSVCMGEYEEKFRPSCEVFFTEYGASIDLVAMS